MRARATLTLMLTLALEWSTCGSATLVSSASVPSLTRRAGLLATTYYVRTDGGSPAQCTGLADAPYPGSGTAQSCAWDHPFRALPPDGTPRIACADNQRVAAGDARRPGRR